MEVGMVPIAIPVMAPAPSPSPPPPPPAAVPLEADAPPAVDTTAGDVVAGAGDVVAAIGGESTVVGEPVVAAVIPKRKKKPNPTPPVFLPKEEPVPKGVPLSAKAFAFPKLTTPTADRPGASAKTSVNTPATASPPRYACAYFVFHSNMRRSLLLLLRVFLLCCNLFVLDHC
jgi:hypothetical protein